MTFYRRRVSPLQPSEPIDYKDIDLLRKFISEQGKILPRRVTG
ncbi:MAG: 30S ribosomal protein S18, partial [Gloeomargarita sp. DG02_3_bins_56]